MSLALAPHPGNEMDDSIMQDDHPTDVAINIDMESPKHHAVTPQAMVFVDAPAPQGFWIQTPATEVPDQLVDVEFETEGVAYEEDGMMSAAEVEMTTAPAYAEEYEYEMTYETGQPESNFEIEDTVVHDAEVLDAAQGHEPHVASTFTAFATEAIEQPQDVLEATVADAEAPPATVLEESVVVSAQAEPEATENPYAPDHSASGEVHPTEEEEEATAHPEHDEAIAPVAIVETVELETILIPATTAAEDDQERVEAEASTETTLLATTLEAKSQHESTPLPEDAKEEEPSVADAAHPIEEPSTVADASNAYEEPEADNRNLMRVPPVILTAISQSSMAPRVFALFDNPDPAFIPSSSRQSDDAPVLLLEQHPSLFLKPIAVFLTQLRTELLQSQPHVIPPAEFEYKELQLVVRDLQLILTEDNIYSREITLFDLKAMHELCGLPGYLHLDISLQPRFIDRYRVIRQAIDDHEKQNATDTSTVQTDQGETRHENVNTAATSAQHGIKDEEAAKSLQGERVTGVHTGETITNTEAEIEDAVGEEPPLPPDDEAASSWSEEQEEPHDDAQPLLAGEELNNEWAEVFNLDGTEGADLVDEEQGAQEFVHEDEYVPEDEPGVVVEHDQAEDVNDYDAEEQTADNAWHAEKSEEEEGELTGLQEGFEEGAYEEEAQVQEAGDHDRLIEHDHKDVTQTAEDNVADDPEYDGNEEWDEQDYEGVEGVDNPEAAAKEPTEITAPVLDEDSEDTENLSATELDTTVGLKHNGMTTTRKRSFNEVEGEPEDDLSLSPNSKKPRHI